MSGKRIVSEAETRLMWYADYDEHTVFTRRVFHIGSGEYHQASQVVENNYPYKRLPDQYNVESWKTYYMGTDVFHKRIDALSAVRCDLLDKLRMLEEEVSDIDDAITKEQEEPQPHDDVR